MTKFRIPALCVAIMIVIAASCVAVDAQTIKTSDRSVTSKSARIGLSMTISSEQIVIGQKPWVMLTVKNLGVEEIVYPQDRVYVEGDKGEPPTTLLQRQYTHRLKPGEPGIRPGGFEPLIAPGASFTRKYDLSSMYEFKKPGKYTAYIEVLDMAAPETKTGSGLWVRSSVVKFEMQAPVQ